MLRYAEYLAAQGNEVTIIAPQFPIELVIPAGVKTALYPQKSSRYVHYTFKLAYLGEITRELAKGFDVVIPIFTPLVVHAIYARWRLRSRYHILLLFQDFFEMIWVGRYLRFILGRRSFVNKIDLVVAVSRGIADDFNSVSGVRPRVIPNGIEDVFYAGEQAMKGRYVLFVGRPGKSKGFDVFEKAMALVVKDEPDISGVVVSTEVENGMIGSIQSVQFQNREQLRKLYAEALVYVHASIGESFGLPPLEAMASGTATVVTKTTGTNDYARDGVNCMANEYGDHAALARKILRLIRDESFRSQIEERGRETAAEYKWANSLRQFEQAVQSFSARD